MNRAAVLRRRPIGSTGLAVTELGFGSASMGNLYAPISDDEARGAVLAALAGGVGYFDVAPYYGFGLAERRLGEALSSAAAADDLVVSTKVGRVLEADLAVTDDAERHGFRSAEPFSPRFDYSRDGVMRSFEESVARLGAARVGMLLIHDIGEATHGRGNVAHLADLEGGGFAALAELKAAGNVSAIGAGVNDVAAALDLLGRTDLDAILLAGRYTLLDQQGLDDLLPRCVARGVSVIVGGPFNSGALAGSSAPRRYDYRPLTSVLATRIEKLGELTRRHHVPLPAAALQFPIAHPAVASVIPGVANEAQARQALEWFRHPIPQGFWDELRATGLIRSDAPLPRAVPA